MNPELEKWYSRYRDLDEVIEAKGEPELVRNQHYLQGSGKAVDLASGKGANALYLASLGYDVTAVDCVDSALQNTQESARYHGLSIQTEVVNLREPWKPETSYNLISMIRFLDRDLLKALPENVMRGGLLFVKTFNENWLAKKPGFNPEYVLRVGELSRLYSSFEVIDSNEAAAKLNQDLTSSFFLGRKT